MLQNVIEQKTCPCGSNTLYQQCCGLYIEQKKAAPTAEALMRSRYSAYSQKNEDYILSSWHPTTRPMSLNLHTPPETTWLNLRILYTRDGQPTDSQGVVAFIASYYENTIFHHMCEKSRFEKLNNRWYYLDGEALSVTQNGPCPCGSGKKFKRCCGGK